MRKKFWDWYCQYMVTSDKPIYFIHNDLWRLPIPSQISKYVIDLGTQEDNVWNVASGIMDSGYDVIVYGVGFFSIGRLESLRTEIVHSSRVGKYQNLVVLNAGAVGYDKYGPEHGFFESDDMSIMKTLGFRVCPETTKNDVFIGVLNNLTTTNSGYRLYIRSGLDS